MHTAEGEKKKGELNIQKSICFSLFSVWVLFPFLKKYSIAFIGLTTRNVGTSFTREVEG